MQGGVSVAQPHVLQRRRNLKAPSGAHSMSCSGLNGIMTITGGGSQPSALAKLNLSSQNHMQDNGTGNADMMIDEHK